MEVLLAPSGILSELPLRLLLFLLLFKLLSKRYAFPGFFLFIQVHQCLNFLLLTQIKGILLIVLIFFYALFSDNSFILIIVFELFLSLVVVALVVQVGKNLVRIIIFIKDLMRLILVINATILLFLSLLFLSSWVLLFLNRVMIMLLGRRLIDLFQIVLFINH